MIGGLVERHVEFLAGIDAEYGKASPIYGDANEDIEEYDLSGTLRNSGGLNQMENSEAILQELESNIADRNYRKATKTAREIDRRLEDKELDKSYLGLLFGLDTFKAEVSGRLDSSIEKLDRRLERKGEN